MFIDNPFWQDGLTADDLKWLYTAMTRATEKVYLVNFKKELFDGAKKSVILLNNLIKFIKYSTFNVANPTLESVTFLLALFIFSNILFSY